MISNSQGARWKLPTDTWPQSNFGFAYNWSSSPTSMLISDPTILVSGSHIRGPAFDDIDGLCLNDNQPTWWGTFRQGCRPTIDIGKPRPIPPDITCNINRGEKGPLGTKRTEMRPLDPISHLLRHPSHLGLIGGKPRGFPRLMYLTWKIRMMMKVSGSLIVNIWIEKNVTLTDVQWSNSTK